MLLSAQQLTTLGNSSQVNGNTDAFNSNMVINEADTHTNLSGLPQTIIVEKFNFYATQLKDPVTPFIVKVNGDNDFTVLLIGTTRTSSEYVIGDNSFSFLNGGANITINNNETIAIGFLDSNADGSNSGQGSVIPFDTNLPDEIWYTGGTGSSNSGSIVVGSEPNSGSSIYTNLFRNYHFNLEILVESQSNSQPGGFDNMWSNYGPSEFGPKNINFDYTGVRNIEATPPPGVHPRIYLSPNEIPALRQRLKNTASGKKAFKQMHAYTTLNHLGYVAGGYSNNASYSRDEAGEKFIDNPGAFDRSVNYSKLIDNDPNAIAGAGINIWQRIAGFMALEAIECLVMTGEYDSDTNLYYDDRAAKLGKAMSNWAQIVMDDADLTWENYMKFGGIHMALAYDFNYNSMTTQQRDSVRMALGKIVAPKPRYGSDVKYYSTTSNWVGLNTFELLTNYALEGEVGHNPNLEADYMRAYRNFLTYGWYESGAPHEGIGKNYVFTASLVAAAKRGYSLLGHPHLRAYGNNFLPAITQPYKHGVIGADAWGGTGRGVVRGGYKNVSDDYVGLKWAFPNDEGIDFAWRNFIEKDHSLSTTGYVYQKIPSIGYLNNLAVAVLFTTDYNSNDLTTQAENVQSESFIAPVRGLVTMRNGFDDNAMMTYFHCRQNMGGHTYADRNSFTLSSLGRDWVRYSYNSNYNNVEYHSCPLIDDIGIISGGGGTTRQPGKLLNFEDDGNFVQVTGDATYAYSWEWHWSNNLPSIDHPWIGTNGWTKVTETFNDFQYQPSSESHHNIPYYNYASWFMENGEEHIVKRPYNPMQRVYRTVGMARTDRPYLIIADDLQKDNDIHNYKWVLQTASDLTIESTDVNIAEIDYRCDVIMAEPNGNRKMLVRVLNNEGYDGGAPAYLDTFLDNTNGNYDITRLIVEADVITPNFKVMLYPFTEGDPLPVTNWNVERDELIVSLDNNDSVFNFEEINGQTHISMTSGTLSSNDEDIENTNMAKLYPTITNKILNVELSSGVFAESFEIYSTKGILYNNKKIESSKFIIDVSNLTAGLYIVNIKTKNKGLIRKKIIKY